MKRRFWKIEYSYTLIVIFAVILFLVPTSFHSKEAAYISRWNEVYNKLDYLFNAISAQAESDIVKGLKNAKTREKREFFMMELVKSYLDLSPVEGWERKYFPMYMNGTKVAKTDDFYFKNLYVHSSGVIVGIKDLDNQDVLSPGFMMFVDLNGMRLPNIWGKDIFAINIYTDGKIRPLGYGNDVADLKADCSVEGTGVTCSHYYRIGGDFNE